MNRTSSLALQQGRSCSTRSETSSWFCITTRWPSKGASKDIAKTSNGSRSTTSASKAREGSQLAMMRAIQQWYGTFLQVVRLRGLLHTMRSTLRNSCEMATLPSVREISRLLLVTWRRNLADMSQAMSKVRSSFSNRRRMRISARGQYLTRSLLSRPLVTTEHLPSGMLRANRSNHAMMLTCLVISMAQY